MKNISIAVGSVCLLANTFAAGQQSIVIQDDSGYKGKPGEVMVCISPADEIGSIKPMNAVNNGPNFSRDANKRLENRTGHFVHYRNMRTPMARIHDSRNMASPPGHMGDINLIFPNWNADENDPKNYDFTLTDWQLHSIRLAGTEIMFRLGNSSDQGPKQYGAASVPKDFGKWARVAEKIIRHYNEGWGWSTKAIPFKNQFAIRYWEIWNEPDLGCPKEYWQDHKPYWKSNPRYWNGPPEKFFEFYAAVAKQLKQTFPNLYIGGPAGVAQKQWTEHFLAHCQTNAVPIDFFSWHVYAKKPEDCIRKSAYVRSMLDRFGYEKAESILNEWNWMKGWYGDDFRKSVQMHTMENNYVMAAFYGATMCAMQDTKTDMLMYYDARMKTSYNCIFDQNNFVPKKGYYPFYAWSKLNDLSTQIKTVLRGERKGTWATAARGRDGSLGIMLARYTLDANVTETITAKLKIDGRKITSGRCHLVDEFNKYTEVPLAFMDDGTAEIDLRPNAFAYIEFFDAR